MIASSSGTTAMTLISITRTRYCNLTSRVNLMAPGDPRRRQAKSRRLRPGGNAHGLVINVLLILVCLCLVTGRDTGCDRLKHGGE